MYGTLNNGTHKYARELARIVGRLEDIEAAMQDFDFRRARSLAEEVRTDVEDLDSQMEADHLDAEDAPKKTKRR